MLLKKSIILTALFSLILGFSVSLYSKELSQLQQQIKQQENKIAQQKKAQQQLQTELKQQENQIHSLLIQLREMEAEIRLNQQRIQETDQQIQRLEQQENAQKQKLAQQLDVAYRREINDSLLKRLLTEQSQQNEQMKQYLAHLNQVRLKSINDLQQIQASLQQERIKLEQQLQTQKQHLATQKNQQQHLQQIQQQRLITLNALNRTLSNEQAQLEQLRHNENTLRQEIQRAEQKAKEQERQALEAYAHKKKTQEKQNKPYKPTAQEKQLMMSSKGLGKPTKQYARPVNGKVLHNFGEVQMGEITWKGMVFAAPAGTPVRAIASGRVILAQWFSGHGLMVMVKHGDNDLTLYGYNQAINVKEGQWVNAGDKLAEVGNTGGQPQSSLYFAIRRKGVAINPVGWLK